MMLHADSGPQPGIIEAIPGSQVIQFYADTNDAAAHLRQYGQLILGPDDMGPHVLRVDVGRDFATTVDVVRTWLRSQR
jgi:hypothetical protein